jgi:hypothetical protein
MMLISAKHTSIKINLLIRLSENGRGVLDPRSFIPYLDPIFGIVPGPYPTFQIILGFIITR